MGCQTITLILLRGVPHIEVRGKFLTDASSSRSCPSQKHLQSLHKGSCLLFLFACPYGPAGPAVETLLSFTPQASLGILWKTNLKITYPEEYWPIVTFKYTKYKIQAQLDRGGGEVEKIPEKEKEVKALREQVIKKFIEERAFTPRDVLELTERFANLAKITAAGDVSIKCRCHTTRDKIAIILIARFLGEQLKEEAKIDVKAEVTTEEVSKYAMIDKQVATARLKELVDAGLLTRISPGVFRVRSMSQVEKWVNRLCEKYVKGSE